MHTRCSHTRPNLEFQAFIVMPMVKELESIESTGRVRFHQYSLPLSWPPPSLGSFLGLPGGRFCDGGGDGGWGGWGGPSRRGFTSSLGGTSGFGFDCSGFTHLVYAMHGVTIPRDADAQAVAGTPVARADLQPGDLVFFASKGVVHHVGIYVGGNMMLHAPQTGGVVSVVSLAAQPYASEYAGARRYLR